MKELLNNIKNLKEDPTVNLLINERMTEFSKIRNDSIEFIFKEMCFCIMTANCSAEKCIEIHENMGDDFLLLSEKDLSKRFKELGYRFPNVRASYIVENRKCMKNIDFKIKNEINDKDLRDWLVKAVKGLGYKEASHFLRNIGFTNYAIIDFHIVDLLVKHELIEKPKTMTKKQYLEIEKLLNEIASKLKLNLGKLDLYLWYLETRKILK
ncbi:MAG: N-glycosylase/DNA lyase [Promethearchaeota archaeon]